MLRNENRKPKTKAEALPVTNHKSQVTKTTIMEQKNILRVYGRAELAQLYYGRPVADSVARKWLMNEINQYPGLYDRLVALGFKKTGKIFSRAQVKEIFAAMGPP